MLHKSADSLVICLGECLFEVSFLFYTFFNNINLKHNNYSKEKDISRMKEMQEVKEMNMLINQLEIIRIPLECKSPVEIVIGKAFCRSGNLQNCLNQLLDVAIEAQSKSLAISIHLLGDEHTLTGNRYDRLAFLLHNRKKYEKSIIFRNKATTVRKAIQMDIIQI